MKKLLLLFTIALSLTVCSSCGTSEPSQITEINQEGDLLTMEQIWKIEDPTNLVVALSMHIGEKCQYGDDMSALSKPERVLYITQTLEMEVNNGGFSQFFYNSSGDFSNELVDAFSEIGAVKTAEICQRAISVFGQEIPVDRDEREEMLDECESDEIDEILDECDNAFYEYEDDLTALSFEYVMKNKDSFT